MPPPVASAAASLPAITINFSGSSTSPVVTTTTTAPDNAQPPPSVPSTLTSVVPTGDGLIREAKWAELVARFDEARLCRHL